MNHLRELLDDFEGRRVHVVDDLPVSIDDAIESMFNIHAESAICFSAELSSFDGMTPIKELCEKLPYPVCWFEMNIEKPRSAISGILAIEHDNSVFWIFTRRMSGVWMVLGSAVTGDGYLRASVGSEFTGEWVQCVINYVRVFITTMRCNNIGVVENQPEPGLSKKRRKHGRKPLFSYRTLVLKQERSDGEPLGGTHSSPRLHLRRGHPRQFAPGKWTWVQPCVVGNKQLGMVHKDYKLSDNPFKPNPANFARA